MADAFPTTETGFIKWLNTFVAGIAPTPSKYGSALADVTAATASQTRINTAVAAYDTLKTQTEAALQEKNAAIEAGQTTVRPMVRRAHATPGLAAADLANIGLKPLASKSAPKGAPATTPVGTLTADGHSALKLSFRDSATLKSKAKPPNTIGCEIWMFKGDPQPADPSGYTFLHTETKSSTLLPFLAVDSGKNVWILLRWVSTTGKTGPWSDVVNAKVPV